MLGLLQAGHIQCLALRHLRCRLISIIRICYNSHASQLIVLLHQLTPTRTPQWIYLILLPIAVLRCWTTPTLCVFLVLFCRFLWLLEGIIFSIYPIDNLRRILRWRGVIVLSAHVVISSRSTLHHIRGVFYINSIFLVASGVCRICVGVVRNIYLRVKLVEVSAVA